MTERKIMEPTRIPRVKICCIASIEEAWLAVRQGASALGLVSDMPSGPGVIEEELIAKIAVHIPPGVSSFLLTSKQDTRSIVEQQKRTRVNTIQICDRLVSGTYEDLRQALPGISLVQVVHITRKESVEEAVSAADSVDALLLDSGNQFLPVKELGGTGRPHDWSISREIREIVRIPVFLAGGLNPQNVKEAVSIVGPFGVDVCTGVRTKGHLDKIKLSHFFSALI
jgi:phosphoribosylanthranilate isomerase